MMNNVLAQMAFNAGSLFLGVTIILRVLTFIADIFNRGKSRDGYVNFLCTLCLLAACCCFWVSLSTIA